jgi:hypothetical protein
LSTVKPLYFSSWRENRYGPSRCRLTDASFQKLWFIDATDFFKSICQPRIFFSRTLCEVLKITTMNAFAIETAGLWCMLAILSPKQAAYDADDCNSRSDRHRRQRPPEISDSMVTLDQNFERPNADIRERPKCGGQVEAVLGRAERGRDGTIQ